MAIVERRALPQPNPGNRSKVCSFWQQNRCLKGSSCEFLHAENRLQPPETRNQASAAAAAAAERRAFPGRRVVSLKRVSQPGEFQSEDQQQEKKPRASVSQSLPICKYWQNGRCKFGDKCNYWHPKEDELQPGSVAPRAIAEKNELPAAAVPTKKASQTDASSRLNKPCASEAEKKSFTVRIHAQRVEAHKRELHAQKKNFASQAQAEAHLPSKVEEQTNEKKKQQAIQQPSGLELVTTLKAHDQSVTGIALLIDSALLFTGSSDETVKAWNCESGQCLDTIRVEGRVRSIASASGWVFVAAGDRVQAWNPRRNSRVVLSGATGEITVLATGEACLIAGTKLGTICGWSIGGQAEGFSPGRSFEASRAEVSALRVAGGRIFSGFSDGSIKLWDLRELRCLRAVSHNSGSPVTGLALCSCVSSLVSSSGEGEIRSWGLESLESGAGSEKLAGGAGVFESFDGEGKPVLGCLYGDSTMKMFGLPALEEKGKIFSGAGISRVVSSPETGLVFVGDDGGAVNVWRWIHN